MTATMPAQLSTEEFEALEAAAPEPIRLEFVKGRLEVKPVPDGDHGEIVMWVLERCLVQRPELRLYPEAGPGHRGVRAGTAPT